MATQEPEQFIIRQFGEYRKRDDIIMAVCENYKMNWQEAEALVRHVETEGAAQIESQRLPMLRIISGIITVGGLVLTLGMFILALMGISLFFLFLPIPYSINVILAVVGLGMMVGGIQGFVDLLKPRQKG